MINDAPKSSKTETSNILELDDIVLGLMRKYFGEANIPIDKYTIPMSIQGSELALEKKFGMEIEPSFRLLPGESMDVAQLSIYVHVKHRSKDISTTSIAENAPDSKITMKNVILIHGHPVEKGDKMTLFGGLSEAADESNFPKAASVLSVFLEKLSKTGPIEYDRLNDRVNEDLSTTPRHGRHLLKPIVQSQITVADGSQNEREMHVTSFIHTVNDHKGQRKQAVVVHVLDTSKIDASSFGPLPNIVSMREKLGTNIQHVDHFYVDVSAGQSSVVENRAWARSLPTFSKMESLSAFRAYHKREYINTVQIPQREYTQKQSWMNLRRDNSVFQTFMKNKAELKQNIGRKLQPATGTDSSRPSTSGVIGVNKRLVDYSLEAALQSASKVKQQQLKPTEPQSPQEKKKENKEEHDSKTVVLPDKIDEPKTFSASDQKAYDEFLNELEEANEEMLRENPEDPENPLTETEQKIVDLAKKMNSATKVDQSPSNDNRDPLLSSSADPESVDGEDLAHISRFIQVDNFELYEIDMERGGYRRLEPEFIGDVLDQTKPSNKDDTSIGFACFK